MGGASEYAGLVCDISDVTGFQRFEVTFGLHGEDVRTTVLSFRRSSSRRPRKRPQKKNKRAPRTTTPTQAITMPAMAPGARWLLEGEWAEGGSEGEAVGEAVEEDDDSAGKGSPGERAKSAFRARLRCSSRKVDVLGLMTPTMP